MKSSVPSSFFLPALVAGEQQVFVPLEHTTLFLMRLNECVSLRTLPSTKEILAVYLVAHVDSAAEVSAARESPSNPVNSLVHALKAFPAALAKDARISLDEARLMLNAYEKRISNIAGAQLLERVPGLLKNMQAVLGKIPAARAAIVRREIHQTGQTKPKSSPEMGMRMRVRHTAAQSVRRTSAVPALEVA